MLTGIGLLAGGILGYLANSVRGKAVRKEIEEVVTDQMDGRMRLSLKSRFYRGYYNARAEMKKTKNILMTS